MALESDPLIPGEKRSSLLGDDDGGEPKPHVGEPKQSNRHHRKAQSVDFAASATKRSGPPKRGLHRKNNSSLSAFLTQSMRNLHLDVIQEDLAETKQNLQKAFEENVEEVKDDGFLDNTLTRSLSILPDDLEDFAQELTRVVKDDTAEEPVEPSGPPLAQYAALVGAVVAVSSNATALHMLVGVSAPLKFFWRMTASHIFLLFLAVPAFRREGLPQLTPVQWMTFLVAVVCYTTQGVLFLLALESTTIGNALMFANSQALLLVIGKACMGERIHPLEGAGVFVAFCGAIICSAGEGGSDSGKFEDHDDLVDEDGNPVDPWDPTPSDDGGASRSEALVGDMLALCSAVAGIGYLTCAKAVRPLMSVSIFLWSVMLCGSFCVLIFLVVIDSEEQTALTWDANPYTGVFGWVSLVGGRLEIVLFLAVVVTGLGTMGFVKAMAYFSTVMIAVATLMEPMLASLIASAMHVGQLPGPLGWLGNLLVALGTLGVVAPSLNQTPLKATKSEATIGSQADSDGGSDEENGGAKGNSGTTSDASAGFH